jgi:hypothetical protein
MGTFSRGFPVFTSKLGAACVFFGINTTIAGVKVF